jgi:ABC-2 type transport system permease protein
MYYQAAAILWAQWRTLRNYLPRTGKGSLIFSLFMTVAWYGTWALGAVGVHAIIADPGSIETLQRFLPIGLFLAFLYWQIVPILMVSTGSSLDLKRLLVYPIPHGQLFTIEVALRLSTAVEMLIMLTAAALGLLRNPGLPLWSPVVLLPFAGFNLLLSAGLRELVSRLFAYRRVRELAVLVIVLAAALPQVLIETNLAARLRSLSPGLRLPEHIWPWGATANIALGQGTIADGIVVLFWVAAAYAFGRWQFERGLRFDAEAARATKVKREERPGWLEYAYRLPNAIFRDPLGGLVEKEIRILSRAPRFRLVFIMGFSFGLLIWLPITFGRMRNPDSLMAGNYLTFISVYALMLMSEVSIWNVFGFDRSAAQAYYVIPVRFSTVLKSKNLAALFFVFLEITIILLVCLLIRLPVTWPKVLEAYAVCAVFATYLLAVGNLSSMHNPKPMNPAQSWRSSGAGRFQAMLLLIYPVLALPIILAYLARYAFESEAAFYAVLAVAAILGAIVYWVAIDSAVSAAEERKEAIVTTLSHGEGPVG